MCVCVSLATHRLLLQVKGFFQGLGLLVHAVGGGGQVGQRLWKHRGHNEWTVLGPAPPPRRLDYPLHVLVSVVYRGSGDMLWHAVVQKKHSNVRFAVLLIKGIITHKYVGVCQKK